MTAAHTPRTDGTPSGTASGERRREARYALSNKRIHRPLRHLDETHEHP